MKISVKVSLLSLFASLFFVSCSDSEDTSPPRLKNHPEFASIFDTIEVKFDETITKFDSTSYSADPQLDCWNEDKRILCVGVDKYPESTNEKTETQPVLLADTTYILTLEEISDKERNELQGDVEVEFDTYVHVDSDFDSIQGTSNNELFIADSIGNNKKWLNGDLKSKVFAFSGILEAQNRSALADDQKDVYFTYLNVKDSIKVKLHSNIETVELKFMGPIYHGSDDVLREDRDVLRVEANTTIETSDSLTVYIDGTRHIEGINPDESTQLGTLKYWIEVGYPEGQKDSENQPTPYVVELSVF